MSPDPHTPVATLSQVAATLPRQIRPRLRRVLKIVVSMLKGGVAKSATTKFLALAFAACGLRVGVVCADPSAQSLSDDLNTARASGFDVPVILLQWTGGTTGMVDYLDHMCAELDLDVMLLDLDGTDELKFRTACLWANQLIGPTSTSPYDYRRAPATYTAVAQIATSHPIDAAFLLTKLPVLGYRMVEGERVPRKGGDAVETRRILEAPAPEEGRPDGLYVLQTEVQYSPPRFQKTFGMIPADLATFPELAAELLADEVLDEVPVPLQVVPALRLATGVR